MSGQKEGGCSSCTSGCLIVFAVCLIIGLPLEAWQASSTGLRIVEVIGLVAIATGVGYFIYRQQSAKSKVSQTGSQSGLTKFKIANYDGGMSIHPSQEAKGDLTLNPDGNWYLLFANLRGSVHAPAGRYPLDVTPTGPSSCHATIRDKQDPSVRAAFDLPRTSAPVFQQALQTYLRSVGVTRPAALGTTLRLPESHGTESSPTQPVPPPVATGSLVEQIKELAALRDSGILTEAEFQAKKTELLARM
jgi:hypothetical protein